MSACIIIVPNMNHFASRRGPYITISKRYMKSVMLKEGEGCLSDFNIKTISLSSRMYIKGSRSSCLSLLK